MMGLFICGICLRQLPLLRHPHLSLIHPIIVSLCSTKRLVLLLLFPRSTNHFFLLLAWTNGYYSTILIRPKRSMWYSCFFHYLQQQSCENHYMRQSTNSTGFSRGWNQSQLELLQVHKLDMPSFHCL